MKNPKKPRTSRRRALTSRTQTIGPISNMGESIDEALSKIDKSNFRFRSLMNLSDETIAPSVDQATAASVPGSGKSPVSQHFLSSQLHYVQICSNQVSQLSSDVLPPDPRLLCTVPAGGIQEGYALPISRVEAAKSSCTSARSNALHHLKFSKNPLLSQSSNPSINGASSINVNAHFPIIRNMNAEVANDFDKASIMSQIDEVSTNAIVPKNQSSKDGNSEGGQENTVATRSREGIKKGARNGDATTTRLRRARINEGIKALESSVPCFGQGNKEMVLDDAIDYIKFLKLQLKVLSQNRLNGEATKYPFVYVEGYGHYLFHDLFSGEPLEEMMGQLIDSDMQAASDLLGSKGLIILPADLASSLLRAD